MMSRASFMDAMMCDDDGACRGAGRSGVMDEDYFGRQGGWWVG